MLGNIGYVNYSCDINLRPSTLDHDLSQCAVCWCVLHTHDYHLSPLMNVLSRFESVVNDQGEIGHLPWRSEWDGSLASWRATRGRFLRLGHVLRYGTAQALALKDPAEVLFLPKVHSLSTPASSVVFWLMPDRARW